MNTIFEAGFSTRAQSDALPHAATPRPSSAAPRAPTCQSSSPPSSSRKRPPCRGGTAPSSSSALSQVS
jgi:hypothetical protein